MRLPLLLAFLTTTLLHAQDAVPLISPAQPEAGWTFSNGQEFPGATGALSVDPAAQRAGHPSLKLAGDFSKGGRYVGVGRKIDTVDIRALSFWLRSADTSRFTLRLNDA